MSKKFTNVNIGQRIAQQQKEQQQRQAQSAVVIPKQALPVNTRFAILKVAKNKGKDSKHEGQPSLTNPPSVWSKKDASENSTGAETQEENTLGGEPSWGDESDEMDFTELLPGMPGQAAMAPRGTVPDMDIQLRPQRPMAHPARQQQPKPPPQAPPECAPSPPPEPSALRAAPLPMPEPEPSPIEEPEPATVREPQPEPVPEPKRAAELEPEPEQEAEPEVPAPAAESKAATPSSPPANENPEDEQTPANWRAAGDGGDNVPASPPPIKADPHAAGLPMYLQTSDTLPHTYIPMPVEEEPVQESMPLPDTSPSDPEDTAAYVPPVPLAQVEEQAPRSEYSPEYAAKPAPVLQISPTYVSVRPRNPKPYQPPGSLVRPPEGGILGSHNPTPYFSAHNVPLLQQQVQIGDNPVFSQIYKDMYQDIVSQGSVDYNFALDLVPDGESKPKAAASSGPMFPAQNQGSQDEDSSPLRVRLRPARASPPLPLTPANEDKCSPLQPSVEGENGAAFTQASGHMEDTAKQLDEEAGKVPPGRAWWGEALQGDNVIMPSESGRREGSSRRKRGGKSKRGGRSRGTAASPDSADKSWHWDSADIDPPERAPGTRVGRQEQDSGDRITKGHWSKGPGERDWDHWDKDWHQDGDRNWDRDRYRNRNRDWDRDKEREGHWDQDSDREREWERDRFRDWQREKNWDWDHDREKEWDKGREREREQRWDKERDGGTGRDRDRDRDATLETTKRRREEEGDRDRSSPEKELRKRRRGNRGGAKARAERAKALEREKERASKSFGAAGSERREKKCQDGDHEGGTSELVAAKTDSRRKREGRGRREGRTYSETDGAVSDAIAGARRQGVPESQRSEGKARERISSQGEEKARGKEKEHDREARGSQRQDGPRKGGSAEVAGKDSMGQDRSRGRQGGSGRDTEQQKHEQKTGKTPDTAEAKSLQTGSRRRGRRSGKTDSAVGSSTVV